MNVIGRRIVMGSYACGEVLPPELSFCEELRISRTPLREAMKRLHAKGLITVGPKRGTRVRPTDRWNQLDPDVLMWRFESSIDLDLIDQLQEMRRAFEPDACRLAALHGSAEQRNAISEAYERLAAVRQNPAVVVEADTAFHRAILTATRNTFMISIGAAVGAALQFQFRLGVGRKTFSIRELDLHREIRDAILDGNGERAWEAMQDLIALSHKTLGRALRSGDGREAAPATLCLKKRIAETRKPERTMSDTLRRPPAIPLVTIDPHTSIWSFADRLTDDWPRHWTGTKMALYAVVRIDGVAWRLMGGPEWLAQAAEQISCRVRATKTEYLFRCGAVEVGLDFVTPLLVDDLDLMSRPVTYVTFSARSLDGNRRKVDCYIDMTGEIAVNLPHERVFWNREERDGVVAMSFRHEHQPILEKAGDHLRIDWGTAYLAGKSGIVTAVVGDINDCRDAFVTSRPIEGNEPKMAPPRKVDYNQDPIIALSFTITAAVGRSGRETVLIGYDDEYAIEFFHQKLRAWWRRNDTLDGMGVLALAMQEKDDVLARAARFDDALEARATRLAGPAYASLCALSWRHTIAAHKLCAGPSGEPLFFSKENFSNGCIATVDVTYPSAPLFLVFNPALVRAMIDPYFAYCASPAWPFKFAAHDLGTYPKANGQTYRGFDKNKDQDITDTQMPIEECGNMLILVGALARADGDIAYVRRHWDMLTQWAEYLVEAGADPGEQLCTDDFSGVLGRNVNLAGKATMGLACYAMLAGLLGKPDVQKTYDKAARSFANEILARAKEGKATRLAFDQPGTWSLKYNLVWDRLMGFNLFPESEMRRELAFYRTKVQPCGVPLDSRSTLTKPEWMLWAASLAHDRRTFVDFVERIQRYADTTPNRVPLCDLYYTDSGRKIGFQARSVLGGLFIAFMDGW
jgi:DNA-binding FadR family transcriptional regulator